MRTKTNRSRKSTCSAARDGGDARNPNVQPAALIARLKREIKMNRADPSLNDTGSYWIEEGLRRAIKIIQREARDAEHNAAG